LKFIVPPKFSVDEIKKAQTCLLEMACSVKDVLESESIQYSLFAGSLIGAHLYGGWIPWDVDFDLAVFDDDYDQALAHLKKKLPKKYLVHNEDIDPFYFASWARVKDSSTKVIYRQKHNLDNYFSRFHCLSLDIYRLKRGSFFQAKQDLRSEMQRFLEKKFNVGLINEKMLYRDYKSGLAILEKKFQNVDLRSEAEIVYDPVKLKGHCLYDDFFPGKILKFEESFFLAPCKPDNILKAIYGEDFKKVPVYSLRQPSLLKVIFNLKEEYWERSIAK